MSLGSTGAETAEENIVEEKEPVGGLKGHIGVSVCLSISHSCTHTLTHKPLCLYSSISPHLHKVKLCKHLQLPIYGPFKHVLMFLPHQTSQGVAVMEASVDKALETGVCVCVHAVQKSILIDPESLVLVFSNN